LSTKIKIPRQDNQLLGYYLIADHQWDLNPHIQQEYKHLFPKLHRIPQPEKKKFLNDTKKKLTS